ncbi:C40 family peptidase [Rothia sp. AR01]|uniref:C40 family peptidase n=1 Tax=Rothia santali TaxID=2949643 RepID=A0A9X2KJ18_9MICC|nr:NlpC/P60 family protein [Rothia santali]MCP3426414.1 C40 family peptidase [Rothia santali]
MAKSTARHRAATKSNTLRNTGIAAGAAAVLVGSVAPANAFAGTAVPTTAPQSTTPSVASYETTSYDATATYTYQGYQGGTDYGFQQAFENAGYVEQAPAAAAAPAQDDSGITTQSTGSSTPASGDRAAIVAAAEAGIGGSYVWGGSADGAWDCSGFVSNVFAKSGINLTAYTHAMKGEVKPTSTPQPGDIVFTNGYEHVGIYVGDGQMISALNPSQGTQKTAVDGGGAMPVDGYYTAF